MNNEITAAESFSITVEKISINEDLTLLEALAKHADYYGILDNKINNYITRSLREKIEVESNKLGLFKNNVEIATIDECF